MGCIRYLPKSQIKSIITNFLSINSPSDLFYGDTVRASIAFLRVIRYIHFYSIPSIPVPYFLKPRILYLTSMGIAILFLSLKSKFNFCQTPKFSFCKSPKTYFSFCINSYRNFNFVKLHSWFFLCCCLLFSLNK